MFMLNFHSFFQYECCLRFDIRKDRMAHILSHYIQTDVQKLRENLKQFAVKNSDWITKVGIDVLRRSQLTTDQYIKNICNGTIPFDELAVLVTCRIYNVHCEILLKNSYWTTHPNSMFHDSMMVILHSRRFLLSLQMNCPRNLIMSQAMSQVMRIYRELVYWKLKMILTVITKKQLPTNTLKTNNPLRNRHRIMAINRHRIMAINRHRIQKMLMLNHLC